MKKSGINVRKNQKKQNITIMNKNSCEFIKFTGASKNAGFW